MKPLHLSLNSNAGLTLVLLLSAAYFPVSAQAQNDFRFLADDATPEQLVQVQPTEDRRNEAIKLNEEGFDLFYMGQYQEAVEKLERALIIFRELRTREEEAMVLIGLGEVYNELKQYSKAIEYCQQALIIFRETGDRETEAIVLNALGEVYSILGYYQKAIDYSQQALTIVQEEYDLFEKTEITTILNNLSSAYFQLENYEQALEFYRFSDWIYSLGTFHAFELNGSVLMQMHQNIEQGNFQQALKFAERALAFSQESGDISDQISMLNGLGVIHKTLGQFEQAVAVLEQALTLSRETKDFVSEGQTLNNLGEVYREQGFYSQSLTLYQRALEIFRDIENSFGEGAVLNNLGLTYYELGQYEKALEFYEQALIIRRQSDDLKGRGTTLNNIGLVYDQLGELSTTLAFYQKALAVRFEAGDAAGVGITLNNMGLIYNRLGKHDKALQSLEQALAIFQNFGYQVSEGNTLDSLGTIYASLGEPNRALQFYQQALAIERASGSRTLEKATLNNIARLLQQQNQPQLAVLFYKQSVNVTETIRQDLRQLPTELQQSYTETVADTYRALADLLLQQDRILEAQRVLDLLKVQELEDYLQNVRGNTNTTQGVPNTPPEQQIWTSYEDLVNQAIPIGQERAQLAQVPRESLTPEQQQRLSQLIAAQEALNREFNAFIRSPEVEALIAKLSPETRKPDLVDDLEDLNALQRNLAELNQNAVLFYPLILEDRLELVLTTANSPPIRRTVPVTREQLNATVREFRSQLQTPMRSAKQPAQQLYDWLIQPIAADLQAANAETIVYAPDGVLRYIPLAALYDGNQWLVQRFRINNITAASLTNLNSEPQPQPRILAGAFANVSYPVTVGEEEFFFNALPFAGTEVENLAEQISSTTLLFDDAFALQATKEQMNHYTIVHLATHGAFVVGSPEDSFIIFGDGKIATLSEIKNWSLKNVDLVVLSACETGVGGKFDNGEEILGLGYQFQRAGARATIASLWSVDDGGTQALMNGFYGALQGSEMTKAEALRQAQIALITGDYSAVGGERGIVAVRAVEGLEPQVQERLSHPYYWAPFILIGNGL